MKPISVLMILILDEAKLYQKAGNKKTSASRKPAPLNLQYWWPEIPWWWFL